ncbi:MAG: class I SAM-dependent methyltransferase [Pseudomonadota bacterium]
MSNVTAFTVLEKTFGPWSISVRCQPLSPREVETRYDRAAARWDRVMTRFCAASAYRALLESALDDSPPMIGAGFRALDCGTGTGALTEALYAAAPNRFQTDAVDLSPEMLARANGNFRARGIPATVRQASVCALPYPDDQFDLTMAAHVCEHLADPNEALAEMIRVTRPGGRVVVIMSRQTLAARFLQARWRMHLMTPKQAALMMEDAGLAGVRRLSPGQATRFDHFSLAHVATVKSRGRP